MHPINMTYPALHLREPLIRAAVFQQYFQIRSRGLRFTFQGCNARPFPADLRVGSRSWLAPTREKASYVAHETAVPLSTLSCQICGDSLKPQWDNGAFLGSPSKPPRESSFSYLPVIAPSGWRAQRRMQHRTAGIKPWPNPAHGHTTFHPPPNISRLA